jgi:hypothetical protein
MSKPISAEDWKHNQISLEDRADLISHGAREKQDVYRISLNHLKAAESAAREKALEEIIELGERAANNSHCGHISQFLTFVYARIRELKRAPSDGGTK